MQVEEKHFLYKCNLQTNNTENFTCMAWSNSNMIALAQSLNIFFFDPIEPTQLRIITTSSQVTLLDWSQNNLLLALSTQGEQIMIYKTNNFCINDYELDQTLDIENVVYAKWIQGENPSILAVTKNGKVHIYELSSKNSYSNYFNTGLTVDKVDISIKDENSFIIAISENHSCLIHLFEWNLIDTINHHFLQLYEVPKKFKLQNYGELYIKFDQRIEKRSLENYKSGIKVENEQDPFYNYQKISYSLNAVSPNKCLICFLNENTLLFYVLKLKDSQQTLKNGLHFQYDLTDFYLNLNHFDEPEVPKLGKELDHYQILRYERLKYMYSYIENQSQSTIIYHHIRFLQIELKMILYSKNINEEPKSTNVDTSKGVQFKENIEWIKKYILLFYESIGAHFKENKPAIMNKFMDQEKRFSGFTNINREIICGAYYLTGDQSFINIWKFFNTLLQIIKDKIDSPKVILLYDQFLPYFNELKKNLKLESMDQIYSSLYIEPPLNGIISIENREPILIDIITKDKLTKYPVRKCRFCGYMTSYVLQGFATRYENYCPMCFSHWKRVE